jgi:hypothetical protein
MVEHSAVNCTAEHHKPLFWRRLATKLSPLRVPHVCPTLFAHTWTHHFLQMRFRIVVAGASFRTRRSEYERAKNVVLVLSQSLPVARSDGRRNTIQCVGSRMLPGKNSSVWPYEEEWYQASGIDPSFYRRGDRKV